MIQLTTACVSSVDESRGNTSNLLFSGQILPERNAGLNGAPTMKPEPGALCVAAVFDGRGTDGRRAAYLAAGGFRAAGTELHSAEDLEALYTKVHNDIAAAAAATEAFPELLATAAVSAVVDGDRLYLANLGSCRAYLMRDRALYRLSRASADTSAQAAPPQPGDGPFLGEDAVPPFTVKGTLLPGDQLLLCTGWLCAAVSERDILSVLADSPGPGEALLRLSKTAGSGSGDIAAVLLKADKAAD